ncbi:MAG: succinylglutamate desuccinylase, partial [Flavobacteriales bacterium]|nr:succinylglutamate desuccinylase [Flavobacteriales bacterium]
SVQNVGDNDAWAHHFPVHIVRGFSDLVYGCIDHYFSRIGITGFVLEAGQHDSVDSAANHEAILWLALQEACGLNLHTLISYPKCVQTLTKSNTTWKTFEIAYRHELKKEDTFEMQPGFKNFQKIEKDQLLALQNGKEVRSLWNACIYMPLYQSQGNDGFFVVKEVNGK